MRLCVRDSRGSFMFPRYLQICWRIFAKLLSLVHLGTEMNWLDFGVKRSKVKVTAWPNASQIFMFARYLQYLLTAFRQTFVTGASRDRDDLITFLGQKVKVQDHAIPAEAHSTQRYHRVQLFLVVLTILTQSYFYVTLMAPCGISCANVPFRNHSLTHIIIKLETVLHCTS